MMLKKIAAAVLILALTLTALCSCGEMKAEPFDAEITVDTSTHTLHYVDITVKDYGTITVTLDETVAPITVNNFLNLVNSGFYNGLTVLRVQQGFVLQAGENANASLTPIKGEFSSNGVENNLSHKKGILSMARTTEPDSATSQFFIMLDNAESILDGGYAAFGWVSAGMNIVEAICSDLDAEDYLDDYYYGTYMGFLKDGHMPVIESMTVVDK